MTKHSDLPLTSNHWGTYRVETDGGKVTALHGFEGDVPALTAFDEPEIQTLD